MSKIVICGGGPIGLCAAMMLGRDGHRVTVLEADPADHPETPIGGWNSWNRPGVAQFRQPHSLHSRFRMISDVEMPGLTDGLLRAGCVWVDNLDCESLPPTITDRAPRPGDEAMRCVAGRRPVIEWVVAALAQNAPNVTIRRAAKVQSLITGASAISGVPHVAGVSTTSGERIVADLVVDAMGRRSPARRMDHRRGWPEPNRGGAGLQLRLLYAIFLKLPATSQDGTYPYADGAVLHFDAAW